MVFANKNLKTMCLTICLFLQLLHLGRCKSIAPYSMLPFQDCGTYINDVQLTIVGKQKVI